MADATAYLNGLIAKARPGAGLAIPADEYDVDGTIEITKPLQLDGGTLGVKLKATRSARRDRPTIRAASIPGIAISGIEIDGGNPAGGAKTVTSALEGQHGISLLGCHGASVGGCLIHHAFGDGLYLSRAPDSPSDQRAWTEDSTVARNWIHNAGRHGIGATGLARSWLAENWIHDVGRAILAVEPTAGTATGAIEVDVDSNIVGHSQLLFIAARGRGGDASHFRVRANHLIGDSMDIWLGDLDGARRSDWIIEDNVSDTPCGNPQRAVVQALWVDGLQARRNLQPMSDREGTANEMFFALSIGGTAEQVEGNRLGAFAAGQLLRRATL